MTTRRWLPQYLLRGTGGYASEIEGLRSDTEVALEAINAAMTSIASGNFYSEVWGTVTPGTTYGNSGLSGDVTLNLPATPAGGDFYTVQQSKSVNMRVQANAGQTMSNGGQVVAAGGFLETQLPNSIARVEWTGTTWAITVLSGVWSDGTTLFQSNEAKLDEVGAVSARAPSYWESGTVFSNEGGSTDLVVTLPSTVKRRTKFVAEVVTGYYIRFSAPAGVIISAGNIATATGGYIRSNTPGSRLSLEWTGSHWLIMEITGPWLLDE